MAQWYVKELSKITKVSVQTLHHYDRIGLLKPSVRLPNGYRLYSESDLLTLQQIIALKFFGFELAQIKRLLEADIGLVDHLEAQSRFIKDQVRQLNQASDALKKVINSCEESKSIPWETIIEMIGVYRMKRELEHQWAVDSLNDEEIKEYMAFEEDLKTRYTEEDKKHFEQQWRELLSELESNLDQAPDSAIGRELGKRCMAMINPLYGKKFAKLKETVWEKGFKSGNAGKEHGMSPEAVAWLDKAIDAYYRHELYSLLNTADQYSHEEMKDHWDKIMTAMYGDHQPLKDDLVKAGLTDEKVNKAGKEWLKKLAK